MRSMAPCRWLGSTLSRSVRQSSASRALKAPTGKIRVPGPPSAMADCVLVITTRPSGPSGQSPSSSSASRRSSRTTSHGRVVSASQLTRRAAADSAGPAGSMPVAAVHASAYPARIAARLVAEIQTTTSTVPNRHSTSVSLIAIWVLPAALSQLSSPLPFPVRGRARWRRPAQEPPAGRRQCQAEGRILRRAGVCHRRGTALVAQPAVLLSAQRATSIHAARPDPPQGGRSITPGRFRAPGAFRSTGTLLIPALWTRGRLPSPCAPGTSSRACPAAGRRGEDEHLA